MTLNRSKELRTPAARPVANSGDQVVRTKVPHHAGSFLCFRFHRYPKNLITHQLPNGSILRQFRLKIGRSKDPHRHSSLVKHGQCVNSKRSHCVFRFPPTARPDWPLSFRLGSIHLLSWHQCVDFKFDENRLSASQRLFDFPFILSIRTETFNWPLQPQLDSNALCQRFVLLLIFKHSYPTRNFGLERNIARSDRCWTKC